MESYSIILMEKNLENNFLENEVARYTVDKVDFIDSIYLKGKDVYLRLTIDKEIQDWEFYAILDYYEDEKYSEIVKSINEVEDTYNPTWELVFEFKNSMEEMENILNNIIEIHKNELDEVYECIKDKKEEYVNM